MKNKNIYKLAQLINNNFDGHIASGLLIDGGMILIVCGKGIMISDTFDLIPVKAMKDLTQPNPNWNGTTCGVTINER